MIGGKDQKMCSCSWNVCRSASRCSEATTGAGHIWEAPTQRRHSSWCWLPAPIKMVYAYHPFLVRNGVYTSGLTRHKIWSQGRHETTMNKKKKPAAIWNPKPLGVDHMPCLVPYKDLCLPLGKTAAKNSHHLERYLRWRLPEDCFFARFNLSLFQNRRCPK